MKNLRAMVNEVSRCSEELEQVQEYNYKKFSSVMNQMMKRMRKLEESLKEGKGVEYEN